MMRRTVVVALALACNSTPPPDAVSLLGRDLYAPELTGDLLTLRTRHVEEATAAHESNPDDPDALIWLGRRLAYLGEYGRAIEVFSDGVNRHPDDARMYRHRGHRYITTRQLHEAIADFEHATTLIEGEADEVEPDGLPNAAGIPLSTTQSNIWYHLGLAYYITQQYEDALRAYEQGQSVSANDDMRVAMSYWHFMTLTRLGRTEEASALLETISPDLEMIENGTYHDLLLLFKGAKELDDVVDTSGDDDVSLANATVGYGIGFWHELNGRSDDAMATWQRTIEGETWAGFGYIASEAEVAHQH